MLTFVRGNLFESPAKVLVNTVNTVGVMGKGVALTFKQIYPEMFTRYQQICEARQFDIGKLWLYKTDHKWVLNFPTKKHWRNPSRPEYIEAGLKKFADTYAEHGIANIAFPLLGCGNGELDWETVVRPMMVQYLGRLPITIWVYQHDRASSKPEHRDLEAMKRWLRSEPGNLAFAEFWEDLQKSLTRNAVQTAVGPGGETAALSIRGHSLLMEFGTRHMLDRWRRSLNAVLPSKWQILSSREAVVPQDSMVELWQNIRGYGICMRRTFPQGLEELSPWLLPALSTLPYLHEVRVSRPESPSENEIALELREPPAERPNGRGAHAIRELSAAQA